MNHDHNMHELVNSTVTWFFVFTVLLFGGIALFGGSFVHLLGFIFKLMGGPGTDGMNV